MMAGALVLDLYRQANLLRSMCVFESLWGTALFWSDTAGKGAVVEGCGDRNAAAVGGAVTARGKRR